MGVLSRVTPGSSEHCSVEWTICNMLLAQISDRSKPERAGLGRARLSMLRSRVT